MPRLPRIQLEGAIYFITSKGAENQQLFREKADYKMYLELLAKYKSQYKFKLFSYCLLPNRLELLIETGDDATISQIMHDLNSLYTKYFNGRYERHSHLFEARFKSILVEKANYLLKMTRHIHQAAGTDIKEYPYSSFYFYIHPEGGEAAPSEFHHLSMTEEIKEVMSFLKEKDNPVFYEKYCLESSDEETAELEKSLRRTSVLGSERFIREVQSKIKEHAEAQKESGEPGPARPRPVFIFMIGAMVLLAGASSIYLYVSKAELEGKYETLLRQREEEFAEKTKFENRSPLALADLEGTEWEIEKFSLSSKQPKETTKDKIHFAGGHFFSDEFAAKGFKTTNYSLVPQSGGVTIWETIQSSASGDTVTWRGDWQGDAMKGILSWQPKGGEKEDFSFFSTKWAYQNQSPAAFRGASK